MFEDVSPLIFFSLWYSFRLLGHKRQFIRKHEVSSIFLFFKEYFKQRIMSYFNSAFLLLWLIILFMYYFNY